MKNLKKLTVILVAGVVLVAGFVSQGQAQTNAVGSKKTDSSAIPAIVNEKNLNGESVAGTNAIDVPSEKLAFVFLTLTGLIYLTYIGLRKYVGWSKRTSNKKRGVGVIDTIPLGGKRFVTVTRVYDKILVLGVGENNINVLAELTEEGVSSTTASTTTTDDTQKEHFMDILANLAKKKKSPKSPEAVTAETANSGSPLL